MTLSQQTLEKNQIELLTLDELFKQIPKWNKYFISNYGRLLHKNNKGKYTIVNPTISHSGYFTYTLSKPARNYNGKKVRGKNGKPKTIRKCKPANQLVATLFVTNPYPECEYSISDLQVHHKNRVRTDNYYKNLMWLCKNKNGRKDHDFMHSVKKVSIYNKETGQFRTYNDIDRLLKKIDVNIMEFIDTVKDDELHLKSGDGKWNVYYINNHFVGIQFYIKKSSQI